MVSLDVAGTFVTVATSNGIVWLIDLKRRYIVTSILDHYSLSAAIREPRLVSSTSIPTAIPSFRILISSRTNTTGSHVSILISMV